MFHSSKKKNKKKKKHHNSGGDNTPRLQAAQQTYTITRQVRDRIEQTIGRFPAETGGILGSSDGGRTIDHYYFDHTARTSGATYSPDTQALNRVTAEWNSRGVDLVGFIHSHPANFPRPSYGDYEYARAIIRAMDVKGRLFTPIVQVNNPPDGRVTIYPYVFEEEVQMKAQPVRMLDDYRGEPRDPRLAQMDALSPGRFRRVENLYPLPVLARKTIISFGCGGSRAFLEDMARSGVGSFILVDGDVVSDTNIGTQQVYISELGMNKVDALKRRILDINPSARVIAVPRFLDEQFTDREFESLVGSQLIHNPRDILICGFTDDGRTAQPRTANLALKYGTSYLSAQLYQEGLAAELYFCRPGVTKSCPRCAMTSRYEAYKQGYRNQVGSQDTPIFVTQRLNATKGHIAMMLLLYKQAPGSRYHTLLDQVADRNFVLIRADPSAGSKLNLPLLDEAFLSAADLTCFDETLWVPQVPNHQSNGYENCPLCGGTGDLAALRGHIPDSRVIA